MNTVFMNQRMCSKQIQIEIEIGGALLLFTQGSNFGKFFISFGSLDLKLEDAN